jgi:hypothetical protein
MVRGGGGAGCRSEGGFGGFLVKKLPSLTGRESEQRSCVPHRLVSPRPHTALLRCGEVKTRQETCLVRPRGPSAVGP